MGLFSYTDSCFWNPPQRALWFTKLDFAAVISLVCSFPLYLKYREKLHSKLFGDNIYLNWFCLLSLLSIFIIPTFLIVIFTPLTFNIAIDSLNSLSVLSVLQCFRIYLIPIGFLIKSRHLFCDFSSCFRHCLLWL